MWLTVLREHHALKGHFLKNKTQLFHLFTTVEAKEISFEAVGANLVIYITGHWPKVDRIEAKNSGKAWCSIRPSQRYGHLQLMNNAVLQKAFRSKNNCVSQLEKQFGRNVVEKAIIRSWWRTNKLPIQFYWRRSEPTNDLPISGSHSLTMGYVGSLELSFFVGDLGKLGKTPSAPSRSLI